MSLHRASQSFQTEKEFAMALSRPNENNSTRIQDVSGIVSLAVDDARLAKLENEIRFLISHGAVKQVALSSTSGGGRFLSKRHPTLVVSSFVLT